MPRVTSIFARSAISPSLWLRQLRSRYAIRAGRNLPDKEFRYLRMVIVTTAVYWGLSSELHPSKLGLTVPLTFQHRAGVSPYTSSCDFARTCVFSKQSLGPGLCDPSRCRPLSRRQSHRQGLDGSGPPSPEVTGAFCRVP